MNVGSEPKVTDAACCANVGFRIKHELGATCFVHSYASQIFFKAVADFSKYRQHTDSHDYESNDDIQWLKRNVMSMEPLSFLLLLKTCTVVRMFIAPGSIGHLVLQFRLGGQHCPPLSDPFRSA